MKKNPLIAKRRALSCFAFSVLNTGRYIADPASNELGGHKFDNNEWIMNVLRERDQSGCNIRNKSAYLYLVGVTVTSDSPGSRQCWLSLKLLALFRHHDPREYRGGVSPANELQIYTWMDATLKELTSLVKEVSCVLCRAYGSVRVDTYCRWVCEVSVCACVDCGEFVISFMVRGLFGFEYVWMGLFLSALVGWGRFAVECVGCLLDFWMYVWVGESLCACVWKFVCVRLKFCLCLWQTVTETLCVCVWFCVFLCVFLCVCVF